MFLPSFFLLPLSLGVHAIDYPSQYYPPPNVSTVNAPAAMASAIARARAFVAKLTLDEKINITTGTDTNNICVGNTGTIPRLHFPGFCLEDSPLGVRDTDLASAFPAAINLGASFDPNLMFLRGQAMGAEHRGKGVNVALGPMMNLAKDPAGGRNWEGFGADPYLSGVGAVQTIKGYHSQGVIACAKHFVANEQEHFRGGSGGKDTALAYSSNLDDRTMHEVYAWPFQESVREGVLSIMCAYNRLNDTFACENSKIIADIAKTQWGFRGFMLSDWAAVVNGVSSARAGLDMNMPGFVAYGSGNQDEQDPSKATNTFWGKNLGDLVRNGTIPMWRVDDMVTRSMTAYFALGQDKDYPAVNFDYKSTTSPFNKHINVQGTHAQLIRLIASSSTVLLKNTKSLLPLGPSGKSRTFPRSIAVLGSDAGPNPNGANSCSDRSCDSGTLAMGWGSGTANFPYLSDPLGALQEFITTDPDARKVGTQVFWTLNDFDSVNVANTAAQGEVCLVFVNADSGEGYITVDGNAGDRKNLTLWHGGDQLVKDTAKNCGGETVVVMHTVGAVVVEEWVNNPNVSAILWAGLPGQESGRGIIDVLFAREIKGVDKSYIPSGSYIASPSGKMPFTTAFSQSDYGAENQIITTAPNGQTSGSIPIEYVRGLEVDYRRFDKLQKGVRWEFGFGGGYSVWGYSGLRVDVSGVKRRHGGLERRLGSSTRLSSSAGSHTVAASGSQSGSGSGSRTVAASGSASASGSAPPSASSASVSGIPAAPAATMTPGGPTVLYDTFATVTFTLSNLGIDPSSSYSRSLLTSSSDDSTSKNNDNGEWFFPHPSSTASQLYITFPSYTSEPPLLLRGFTKVTLGPRKNKKVEMVLRKKDVAVWDVRLQAFVIPHGVFKVSVGESSRDLRLVEEFYVRGDVVLK